MTGIEDGSRGAILMARVLKELQQINEAQSLQDSLRQDLQCRKEQARQSLIASQNQLDQKKRELSSLYLQESKRQVLRDISVPANVNATKKCELTKENVLLKKKIMTLRNEQVQMCIDKLAEHDKMIGTLQSSSVLQDSVSQEVKAIEAQLLNLERKITGVTASTKAAANCITKLQSDLKETEMNLSASSKSLSDLRKEFDIWLEHQHDVVRKIIAGTMISDVRTKEFLTAAIQWMKNEETVKAKELQLLTDIIRQRQHELKSLT